jgi:thiamine biosynthesis lipoprotein
MALFHLEHSLSAIDILFPFVNNEILIAGYLLMLKKIILPVMLLFLCLSGCRLANTWQKTTFLFFDTVCEINLFCSPSDFAASKVKIRRVFQDIEDHFSPGSTPNSSPLLINLYKKALSVYHDSNGCFDITVAPLSSIWGFREHSYRVPSPEEINGALQNIGMDKILLEANELFLPPGMELDWGGIAKGFGVDLASQAVIQMGIKNGFINAGGDLYCWGKNPDKKPWQIGIKNPRGSGISAILSLSDIGAATTGDYQRFFIQDGIRYHHVFDPKSGHPSQGKQSVTVVGPEALICDALSTALFVSHQPDDILKKFPQYGAFVIDAKGVPWFIGKNYPIRINN